MEQELKEKWLLASNDYNERYEDMLGCCGGDYCNDPNKHKERILDFFLTARKEEIESLIKEVEEMKKDMKTEDTDLQANVLAEMYGTKLKAFDYGTNSSLKEVITLLQSKLK